MESLPLKEPDFGLQKRTGPSSGIVASIVLVSPGLDCPGLSLVEVCATCLRCHLEYDFHELQRNLKMFWKLYISCSTHIFYITRMPISYSGCLRLFITSIHQYFIFVGLQRSIGQPKV